MSIKVFLSIFIIGIITTLNASLGNGTIDGIKMKKVENQTIFNQEAIKDAIYKYVRINREYPNTLNELITQGVLTNDYNNNAFNGNYSISIDKPNKELKITTSIADNDIRDYFQRTLINVQRFDIIGDSISSIYSIPVEILALAIPLFIDPTILEETTEKVESDIPYTYRCGGDCLIYENGECRLSVSKNCTGYKKSYDCPSNYSEINGICTKTTYSCQPDYTLQPDNQCKLNN